MLLVTLAVTSIQFYTITHAADKHWFITVGDDDASTGSDEYGYSITSSGGYLYVAGTSNILDSDGSDIVLSRVLSGGDVDVFMVVGNGTTGEYALDMAKDPDGYIYVTGYIDLTDDAGLIVKFNPDGAVSWVKEVESSGSNVRGQGIVYGSDGYIYIAGSYDGRLFVAGINPGDNSILWFNVYSNTVIDTGSRIGMVFSDESATTKALYLAFNNYTKTSDGVVSDIIVVKLNASDNGKVVWSSKIGGSGNEYAGDVILEESKYVLVVGSTNSYHFTDPGYTDYNIFVLFLDQKSGGGLDSHLVMLGKDGANDYGRGILFSTGDGNLYITGETEMYNTKQGLGYIDAYVAGLDVTGGFRWMKILGGSKYDYMKDITVGPGGYLYTTGYTDSFGQGGYDLVALLASDVMGNMTWTNNDFDENVAVYDASPDTAQFNPTVNTVLLTLTAPSEQPAVSDVTLSSTDLAPIKSGTTVHTATDETLPDPVPEPWTASLAVLVVVALTMYYIIVRH